jgi:2-haloacid dehalogenase
VRRPAVVFDVLGTLFHLTPLEERLGGKAQVDAWFERLLHSATALTLAGTWQPFESLAESTLKTALARIDDKKIDADEVLAELAKLPPYPDAGAAFDVLEQARVTVGVLTNGGERATRKLLEGAGLEERVTEIVSVEEIELYKPHPAVYKHAAERIGVEPKNLTLIAAHAWDVAGAKAAGLNGIWIDRVEREWPLPKGKPRKSAADLEEAARLAIG